MSKKIIGVTVGTPLPKPNLMQTDPTKGDYVKGKEKFLERVSDVVEEYLKNNPTMGGGFIASDVAPEDTSVLWVDIDDNEEDDRDNESDDLQAVIKEALEEALVQAKASGEFKGDPGDDYVLTEADKQEIAELTAQLVDVPSGGGGSGSEEPFRLINTITITEEIVNPKINVDSDGKAFSVKEIVLYFDRNTITSTSGKHYIALNSNNAYQISAENYFLTTASVNARRAVYAKIMEGSGLCEIRMYTNAQSANVSMVGYDASGVPSMTKITSVLIKATLTGGTIKLYGR